MPIGAIVSAFLPSIARGIFSRVTSRPSRPSRPSRAQPSNTNSFARQSRSSRPSGYTAARSSATSAVANARNARKPKAATAAAPVEEETGVPIPAAPPPPPALPSYSPGNFTAKDQATFKPPTSGVTEKLKQARQRVGQRAEEDEKRARTRSKRAGRSSTLLTGGAGLGRSASSSSARKTLLGE